MWAYIEDLLNTDSLSPHGICLLWRPELIWTHVVSDFLIGASYFSIPVFLGWLVWRRPDVSFNWVIWCFALFILACGTTHFFSIWTLWRPDYGVEAVIKLVTAGVSVATAVVLWPLLPKALAWPSPAQLSAANGELMALVTERDAALTALRRESAERARAEDMLRQAQKMEALGQLTGGVAHDFNNLLTVISMNLDRIDRKTGGDDRVLARSLAHARSAAEKAAAITGRMLSFARKEPLDAVHFDARQVVRDLEPFLRDVVRGTHVLGVELQETACPICTDRHQFENAILNLTINARDALPESGGEICIRVLRHDGEVTVVVADNGSGMSDEVRSRAFEPFFTTKAIGKGSGLGLSQVFGFVQQSDGRIAIESAPGQGTRIHIHFPVCETAP